jgi:ApaG protein
MVTELSQGIRISVENFYQEEYSNPVNQEFLFAYRITIENHNHFTIQLLHRHWTIIEGDGQHRVVEGEGVVGVQPVLKNGQQFQYSSGCNLRGEIGRMQGYYVMQNQHTLQQFRVKIPNIDLVAPFKNN